MMSHSPAHHSAVRSVWPWPERDGSVRLECWLRPEGGMEVAEENVSPPSVNNHCHVILYGRPVVCAGHTLASL